MIRRIFNKATEVLNNLLGRVRDRMERRGMILPIAYKTLHMGESIEYDHPYPANFKEQDKPLFHGEHSYKTYSTSEGAVFELKNVSVSREGVVFQKLKTFAPALPHPMFRNKFGWLYLLSVRLFRKKKPVSDPASYVLAFDHWSAVNYYHWMADSLPRIFLARKHLKDPVFLLPENPPHFITASLQELGIDKIRFIQKNEYLFFDTLYVQQYAAAPGQQHAGLLMEIRSAFLKGEKKQGTERIYVSRGKQKVRKISNEAPLLEILRKEGFRVVYFEDHSFAEQIRIMSNASVLVSSHGANMANMLFMPENARIFEWIRNDQPNFCYWSMSNSLQFRYYYQLCPLADRDNIAVDAEEFRNNLKQLLNA